MIKNIDIELKKLGKSINEIEKNLPNYELDKLIELKESFDEIATEIILSKGIPTSIKQYLTTGELKDNNIPKEYVSLVNFSNLQKKIGADFTNKINEEKDMSFSELIKNVMLHTIFDNNNSKSITIFEEMTIKYKIAENFIKLYRDFFVDTGDIVWLEKIGDLQYKTKNYNTALETYLNVAEVSEPSISIYKKLANTFKKLDDKESYNFCLEQINTIKRKHVN